jgi:hypothetical protein
MCFESDPPFAGGNVDLVDRSLRVFSREAVNPVARCPKAVYPARAEGLSEAVIYSACVTSMIV